MTDRHGAGPWPLVATCSRGLEEVVAEELRTLGHDDAEVARGAVTFSGGMESVYRANLWLRAAARVLLSLGAGEAGSRDALYGLTSSIPWDDLIAPGQTLAVDVAGRGEGFRSTAFAAMVVKDAIVDQLRRIRGSRPDVKVTDPDVRVHLHLNGRQAQLALDGSGEPLAHRGYRPRGGPAPLSESLAAGLLLLVGYDGSAPFLDPMCGTGTLPIEAALIATGRAPGMHRRFACERWHWHRAEALAGHREAAAQAQRRAPAPITARDSEPRAVTATSRNARAAGVERWVRVERGDLASLASLAPGSLLVANPPYGERLGDVEGLRPLYRELGDTLKRAAAGSTAWLLVGSKALLKEVGLQARRRIVVFNGPIECRLVRYDVWEGRASPEAGLA